MISFPRNTFRIAIGMTTRFCLVIFLWLSPLNLCANQDLNSRFDSCRDLLSAEFGRTSKESTHKLENKSTSIEGRAHEIETAAYPLLLLSSDGIASRALTEDLIRSTLGHHLFNVHFKATRLLSEIFSLNITADTSDADLMTIKKLQEPAKLPKFWTSHIKETKNLQDDFKILSDSQDRTQRLLNHAKSSLERLEALSTELPYAAGILEFETDAVELGLNKILSQSPGAKQTIGSVLKTMIREARLLESQLQTIASSLKHSLDATEAQVKILQSQLAQDLPGLLRANRAKIELAQLQTLFDQAAINKQILFATPSETRHEKRVVHGAYTFEIELWTPDSKFVTLNNATAYTSARIFNDELFQDVEVIASARITSAQGIADWYLLQPRQADFMFAIEPTEFVLDDHQYLKLVAAPSAKFRWRAKSVRPKPVWVKATANQNIVWNFKE